MANEPFIFGRLTRSWKWAQENRIFEQWEHDKLIVYEHSVETKTSNDKTHIHFVMTDATNRGKIYERSWWKALQLKGNADFSLKKSYNPSNPPFVYMAKGKLEPVYNDMRSQEELRIDRELWKEPVSTTVVNEITIIKKEPNKITTWFIAQEAVQEWRVWNQEKRCIQVSEEEIKYTWDHAGKCMLIKIVSDLCKKYKKGRYYRNVAQICQEAIAEISPADWHDKVFSML